MEKGQEPSKNTALNIFPWFNLLGSLKYLFPLLERSNVELYPIRQEDWTFVPVTTPLLSLGQGLHNFRRRHLQSTEGNSVEKQITMDLW